MPTKIIQRFIQFLGQGKLSIKKSESQAVAVLQIDGKNRRTTFHVVDLFYKAEYLYLAQKLCFWTGNIFIRLDVSACV